VYREKSPWRGRPDADEACTGNRRSTGGTETGLRSCQCICKERVAGGVGEGEAAVEGEEGRCRVAREWITETRARALETRAVGHPETAAGKLYAARGVKGGGRGREVGDTVYGQDSAGRSGPEPHVACAGNSKAGCAAGHKLKVSCRARAAVFGPDAQDV